MTAVSAPDGRKAPINQLVHMHAFPDPTFTDVVSPNADTLYSAGWIDLSKEPMILSVPDMDRYYVMQMLDAWTNVFASPGTRTTGNGKGDFAIIGPSWHGKTPDGLKPLHCPTRFLFLIGRTQTNGNKDYGAVNAIQDRYKLTPLNAWGRPYTPPQSTPFNAGIDTRTPPIEQVLKMDARIFFARLNHAMKDNPPDTADSPFLDKFASIGVAPGRGFDMDSFEPEIVEGIHKGADAAKKKMRSEEKRPRGQTVNGWETMPANTANFGTDYNTRAYIAMFGLGANLPADAIYPHTAIDTQGQPLNGKDTYVIRFPKGQLPPVQAFWSITAYNSRQFFIPNSINRYTIGDRDKLKMDADGGLTIYLGNSSPGAEKESNWLPVGGDGFNLMMRLYWPKDEIVNGTWKTPGVERVRQ
jgi:hypothetical protein